MTFAVDVHVHVDPSTPVGAEMFVGADVRRPGVMLRIGRPDGSGSSVVVSFDSPGRLIDVADSMITTHREWTDLVTNADDESEVGGELPPW